MRENLIFSLTTALMMGTFVLSSCSSDELPVGNEVQQLATESAMTYSFSVPAVMGEEADTRVFDIGESSIVSKFHAREKVYVFMKRGNQVAYAQDPLYPKNVSNDGKTCTLEVKNLYVYTYNATMGQPKDFIPMEGDEVYLYYGLSVDQNSLPLDGYFDFSTKGTVGDEMTKDYSLAVMKVAKADNNNNLTFVQKEDSTKTYFSFKNINSIFRQKVTFIDYDSAVVTPNIKEFTISLSNGKTVKKYSPFSSEIYTIDDIKIDTPVLEDGNIYFSMFFNDENDGSIEESQMVFTALDDKGFKYVATKSAPTGVFKNNKYYYGNVALKMDIMDVIIPKIATDPNTSIKRKFLTPDGGAMLQYVIDGDFTLSGNSENCCFVAKSSEILLDNFNGFVGDGRNKFMISFENGDDSVVRLKGDNSFRLEWDVALAFWGWSNQANKTIKFKCEGDEATLKIWFKDRDISPGHFARGFDSYYTEMSNYEGEITPGNGPYTQMQTYMAANGYTVERTAKIRDGDGCYWIFTVKKIQ